MPYYLRHFFDPDFDHTHLSPRKESGGHVDHYNLGYVQNIVMGQAVAEFKEVSEEQAAKLPGKYIYTDKIFPAGQGTVVNPENPDQLLASVNGYVFYFDELIRVKRVLNVRRDLDFHTGNIAFVGDVVAHGAIRSGFELKARNILVKGNIEGARVRALGSLCAESGIKGGKRAVISAGGVRVPFCENAHLRIRESLLVDGALMHSHVHCGGRIVVSGRLQGGEIFCQNLLYVKEQIGGGSGSVTSISMGYDPHLLLAYRTIRESLENLKARISYYKDKSAQDQGLAEEFGPKLSEAVKKYEAYRRKGVILKERVQASDSSRTCQIVVPGVVKPSLHIRMGKAKMDVNDYMENVRFHLDGDEIKISSPGVIV